jgi:hypothetical protein
MQKKLLFFGFYFLTLGFYSCTNNRKETPKEISIQGEQIFNDIIGISSVHSLDDYILLKMTKGLGYGLSLYHKSNLKTSIANFAKLGDGPDEWGAIRVNGQKIKKNGTDYLVVNDGFKNRIKLLNLNKLINDSIENYDYTFQIESRHGLSQSVFFINDSTVISTSGVDSWEHGRLKFYNLKQNLSWVTTLFPILEDANLSPYEQYMLYFSYIHFNPQLGLIASSMDAFDRIDIFNLEGELVNSFKGEPDTHLTKNKNLTSNGGIPPYPVYYKYSTASDRFIYGLYYNQLNTEIEKVEVKTKIRVFDWEGNWIKTFTVDEYLSNIEVYEDDSYIIGIDKVNEKIIKYDISRLMKK